MNVMDSQLDRLLAVLKDQRDDGRLASLEPRVWQRLAARTASGTSLGQLQWRAAAIGLALSLGAAFGGAAAAPTAAPAEMAVFSSQVALAPSTILDGRP
jgi:hypothetical protein